MAESPSLKKGKRDSSSKLDGKGSGRRSKAGSRTSVHKHGSKTIRKEGSKVNLPHVLLSNCPLV